MNRKNREPSRHWRKRHTRQGRAQKVTAASQDGKILEKFIQKGEKKVTKNKERKKMMTNFGWICWKQFFYFLTRRVVAVDCVFSFFLFPLLALLHFLVLHVCFREGTFVSCFCLLNKSRAHSLFFEELSLPTSPLLALLRVPKLNVSSSYVCTSWLSWLFLLSILFSFLSVGLFLTKNFSSLLLPFLICIFSFVFHLFIQRLAGTRHTLGRVEREKLARRRRRRRLSIVRHQPSQHASFIKLVPSDDESPMLFLSFSVCFCLSFWMILILLKVILSVWSLFFAFCFPCKMNGKLISSLRSLVALSSTTNSKFIEARDG